MFLPNPHKRRGLLPHLTIVPAALLFAVTGYSAELTPACERAFNHYVELSEARMPRDFHIDPALKSKLHAGDEITTAVKTTDDGNEIKVPGGLIQDWLGAIFIPNTTIAQIRPVMQAYPDYKRLFAPEVIESKLLRRDGNRFEVFLRLYKKQILTVVLNATYDIRYAEISAGRMAIDSRSTRIAEAKGGEEEYPVGQDDGFLWRLNSYWRFEQGDGGVYAQCEAISLSRDVPFGLLMIRKFVERFPKDSMTNTLEGVRRAVR